MARCGCAGTTCACVVEGSGSVEVTGAGSQVNPFVVVGPTLNVTDTATVNLTKSGAGTASSPWSISADATVSLDALTDVSTAGGVTGHVLTRQSDGSWAPAPPATATPGLISHDGSMIGDGSGSNPLGIDLGTNSLLEVDATGVRVQGTGIWTAYTPAFTSWSGTNPVLGNGSITGRYMSIGKTVFLQIRLVVGSTTQRGTGFWNFSLPLAARASTYQFMNAYLVNASTGFSYMGLAEIVSTSTSKIGRLHFELSDSSNREYSVDHDTPTTFGSGSWILVNGAYEAA